jgi:O-antigen/teichoic acid export membrane protein
MAPASSLIRLTSSVANSRRRFQLSYVPDFLFRPFLLLCFLGTVWFLSRPLLVENVLWVIVSITALVALTQAWILGADALPVSLRPQRHDLAPRLRGRAASMVIVAGVAASFADIVTLIGGLFLPASGVAELGIAVRLAALAGFVTQATQNFVLPDLTAAIARGQRKLAEALIFRINLIAITAIAGCVAGAALFGPLLLGVFGPDYTGAHWPLVLFMLSQLFRAAGGMNQHLLSIDGYQARSANSCIFSLVVLVAASVVLTPKLGVLGMAIAVLLADAVWAAALGLQAQHYSGYRGDIFAVLRFRRGPAE